MNFYKIAHKELVIKTARRYRNVFPLAVQAIADKRIDISGSLRTALPLTTAFRPLRSP